MKFKAFQLIFIKLVRPTTYVQDFMSTASTVETLRIVIKPTRPGMAHIGVHAIGARSNDDLELQLNVLPEGAERVQTTTVLLLKESSASIELPFSCNIPPSVQPETVEVQISFVEDLLGDAFTNLEDLLAQPVGCGEQNLARFANAIVIHTYLSVSDQLTEEVHDRIMLYVEGRQNLQGGVQKHLVNRSPDGGYKYFSPTSYPSTFLTAFTVKIFSQARTFMAIDQNLIDTAVAFVLSRQESDGGFYEDFTSELYQHHGGLRGRTVLTAYVSIILSQLLSDHPEHLNARNQALTYVLQRVNNANAFELAVVCYALHLAGDNNFQARYNVLLGMATVTSDIMFWDVKDTPALNVETAAYALLFISKIDAQRATKLARFIVSKKNGKGGWSSTQETVTAIEALASAAAVLKSFNGSLEISVMSDAGDLFSLNTNEEKRLNQQTFNLDPTARSVAVIVRGSGWEKVTASFSCRYFEKLQDSAPRFSVSHRLLDNCNTPLKSEICINYLPEGADQQSNMVIMKMTMPSGYAYDPDTPLSSLIRVR